MRFNRLQFVLSGLFGLTALALAALAFLAGPLGLSQGTQWGRARLLLIQAAVIPAILAGLVLAWGWIARLARLLAKKIVSSAMWRGISKTLPHLNEWRPFSWLSTAVQKTGNLPGMRLFSQRDTAAARLLTIIILTLALLIYIFYQTAGLFSFKRISDYYDMQAEAFLKGQTALLLEPDPRLAALANPYDFRQREQAGVSVPWDVSYFKGKFHLYWGPAPALAAAGVRLISGITVDDQFLLLGALIGLQIVNGLFFLELRRRFFPETKAGLLVGPLLVLAFTPPVLYLLNRPSVYEAAIVNGQLGLIAGVFCAYKATESAKPARWLLLAGLCWTYAINSRVTLLVAVGFLSLVYGWLALRANPKRIMALAAALLLPLAAGVAGLALFNLARFGSPFESGWRYQLTGDALPSNPSAATSLFYIPANLYAYVLRPLRVEGIFPFLIAPWKPGFPAFLPVPEFYYTIEPSAGILLAAPFVLAVALAKGPLLKPVWSWLVEKKTGGLLISASPAERSLSGVALAFLGGGLLALAPLLVFIAASQRYEMDFLPLLLLAAGLGWMWAHQTLEDRASWSRLLDWIGGTLILVTVINGLLLGFSGYNNRIEALNPALYYGLIHFFGR